MKKIIALSGIAVLMAGVSVAQDDGVYVQKDPNQPPLVLNCPATIQVQIASPQQEWQEAVADASFVRAESWVGERDRAVAVCIYTAWGGEFKIQQATDRHHSICSAFTQQGGTGGVRCE